MVNLSGNTLSCVASRAGGCLCEEKMPVSRGWSRMNGWVSGVGWDGGGGSLVATATAICHCI